MSCILVFVMSNFHRGVQHSGTRTVRFCQVCSSSVQIVQHSSCRSARFCQPCPTARPSQRQIPPRVFISQALKALDYVQGNSSARQPKLNSVQDVHQPGTHSVRFCPGKFISQTFTALDSVQGVHQPGTHSVRFGPGRSSARHSKR